MDPASKFAALAAHAKEMAQSIEDNWETEVKKSVHATSSFQRCSKRPRGEDKTTVSYESAKIKDVEIFSKYLLFEHCLMVPPGYSGPPDIVLPRACESIERIAEMHKVCIDMVKAECAEAITAKYCAAMEDIVVFLGQFTKHIDAPVEITEDAISQVLESAKALVANEPTVYIDVTISTRKHYSLLEPYTCRIKDGLGSNCVARVDTVAHKGRHVRIPGSISNALLTYLDKDNNVCFIGRGYHCQACIWDSNDRVLYDFRNTIATAEPKMNAARFFDGNETVIVVGIQRPHDYLLMWFLNGDLSTKQEKVFPGQNRWILNANGTGVLIVEETGDRKYTAVTFIRGKQAFTN